MAITLIKPNTGNQGGIRLIPKGTLPAPVNSALPPKTSFSDKVGNVAKGIANFFTSSEQGLGNNITSAITSPKNTQLYTQASTQHDSITKSLQDAISAKTQNGQDTTALKNALTSHIKDIPKQEDFTGKIPSTGEVLGNVGGTLLDTLTAGTYGADAKAMKAGELATKAIPTALDKIDTTVAENSAKKEASKITEMVSPRLTQGEAEKIGGTNPKGILGKISAVVSDRTKQIAEAVKGIVNPSKTFTENANNVYKAIGDEATKLKGLIKDSDHPYTFKELNSKLNNIEIPEFIKTGETAVKNRADSIINKFMEIARSKNGKISSLLDTRKEFDSWVQKEYPRIFDEGGNAVNALVKNVRTAANDFIAKEVPDIGVKDSLRTQNLLYEAGDTLSEKAAKGAPKTAGEIGTNRIGRIIGKHPFFSTAVGGGATALAGEKIANVIGNIINPPKAP